jgi:hypothetical protein
MASLVFIATWDYAITIDVLCTDKAQWAFGRKYCVLTYCSQWNIVPGDLVFCYINHRGVVSSKFVT